MRSIRSTNLHTRMLAVALCTLLVAPAAWATTIPVDGFTDGATTLHAHGADAASNESASVPGGQRSIWLSGDTDSSANADASVDTVNHQLSVDGPWSSITLGYGAYAMGGTYDSGGSIGNDPTHAIGADWSGYTGVRIPFLESTSWLNVYINNEFGHMHKVNKAGNLDILFGDWARTNVDMFTISIDNFRPGGYRVGPIELIAPEPEAVPEPAELPLFACGAALLVVGWMFRRYTRPDGRAAPRN